MKLGFEGALCRRVLRGLALWGLALWTLGTGTLLGHGGSAAQAQNLAALNLGVLAPLSGPQKNVGLDIRDAVSLCVEQAGPEFARLGFRLGSRAFDDEHRDTVAKLRAEAMVKDRSILAVVGSYSSSVSLTAAALFSPPKLALITPASSGTALTAIGFDNVNRIVAREDALGEAFATFLALKLGAKTVHLVEDGSAGASPLLEGVSGALEAQGIKLVGRSRTARETDFSQVVDEVKKSNPDVVFYAGEYGPGAGIVRALRTARLNMLFIGGDALSDPSFRKQAGSAFEGVYVGTVAAPAALFKRAKAFGDAFRARFKREASGYGVLSFDACQVALQGLRKTLGQNPGKTPTRAQIQAEVRQVNLVGQLSGDIRFDSRGERLKSAVFLEQYGQDGLLRVVELVSVKAK